MKKIIYILSAFLFLASCGQNAVTNSGSTVVTNTETMTQTGELQKEITHQMSDIASDMVGSIGSGNNVMQVFADFQCPYCQHADLTVTPVLKELADAGKMVVEFRQFPLQMHSNAMGDALASMCALEQNKFMDYKGKMYDLERQRKGSPVSDADRENIAKDLGLDTAKFKECLATKKYEKEIKDDIKLGEKLGVRGTPTYILDGKPLDLSQFGDSIDQLKEFLNLYADQH